VKSLLKVRKLCSTKKAALKLSCQNTFYLYFRVSDFENRLFTFSRRTAGKIYDGPKIQLEKSTKIKGFLEFPEISVSKISSNPNRIAFKQPKNCANKCTDPKAQGGLQLNSTVRKSSMLPIIHDISSHQVYQSFKSAIKLEQPNNNSNSENNDINSTRHKAIISQDKFFGQINDKGSEFVLSPQGSVSSASSRGSEGLQSKLKQGKHKEEKRITERARRMEFSKNLERLKKIIPGPSSRVNSTLKVLETATVHCRSLQVLHYYFKFSAI